MNILQCILAGIIFIIPILGIFFFNPNNKEIMYILIDRDTPGCKYALTEQEYKILPAFKQPLYTKIA